MPAPPIPPRPNPPRPKAGRSDAHFAIAACCLAERVGRGAGEAPLWPFFAELLPSGPPNPRRPPNAGRVTPCAFKHAVYFAIAAARAGLAAGPPLGPPPSDGAATVDADQANFPLRAFVQVKDLPATVVVAPAVEQVPPIFAAVADPLTALAPLRVVAWAGEKPEALTATRRATEVRPRTRIEFLE